MINLKECGEPCGDAAELCRDEFKSCAKGSQCCREVAEPCTKSIFKEILRGVYSHCVYFNIVNGYLLATMKNLLYYFKDEL
ncbi:hypothetical protein D0S48_10625 [Psychrobacillus sp. AK 1817]|nr:hypothetical protein D0S48_10625 [Psychrobacillus sp. AK 1817]